MDRDTWCHGSPCRCGGTSTCLAYPKACRQRRLARARSEVSRCRLALGIKRSAGTSARSIGRGTRGHPFGVYHCFSLGSFSRSRCAVGSRRPAISIRSSCHHGRRARRCREATMVSMVGKPAAKDRDPVDRSLRPQMPHSHAQETLGKLVYHERHYRAGSGVAEDRCCHGHGPPRTVCFVDEQQRPVLGNSR